MSLQALNWAMVQRCGTPAAKMVLIILSRYANAEGWAWPSRQSLADATEQSPDSVDRALRLLTTRGLIEKGGRQIRHDGGDSTVRYRLLFDPRAVDAHLAGNRVPPTGRNTERPGPPSEPEDEAEPPVPQIAAGGVPQDAAGGAADSRQGGAAICGTSQERKESSRGIDPPTPLTRGARSSSDLESGMGASGSGQPGSGTERRPRTERGYRRAAPPAVPLDPSALARFERLWAAYPASGRLTAGRAEALSRFAELTAAEQETAIRTGAAYASSCAELRSQAKALHRWLRDGRWRNGELALSPAAGGCSGVPSRVFVRDGSPEWEAWTAHYRRLGKPMPTPTWSTLNRADGWNFPAALPPEETAAA